MTTRAHAGALDWARQDRIKSRAARRVIGVAAFALATAFGAKVAVPMPGTSVPFTMQVVCVILAGAILGPRLGAASQAAYLAAGVLGAPIFAAGGGPAYLLGPTGGYLLAFPLAAYCVGAIAGAGRGRGAMRLSVALAAGVLVIHAGGAAWLTVVSGSPGQALRVGTLPFLFLDVVKIVLALLISLRIRPRALELF